MQTEFELDLFNAESVLARAKELGLGSIRCNLTGRVIAELSDESLSAAIEFEQYQNPLMTDESIIDSLETRWLIQSSRPAPHLTAHKSVDGFRFLREFYPTDLFALLASRLVFDNMVALKTLESTDCKRRRMLWLIELQNWIDSAWEKEATQALEVLESLIRVDAITDVRRALYSQDVRDLAVNMYNSEFDFLTLAAFVDMVENCTFFALSKMKNAPQGNRMSLSAALAANGATPEQIVAEEEKEMKRREANRAMINSWNAKNAGKSGTVKVNRGLKAVLALSDVKGVLHPALAAKYADELAKHKAKGKTKANKANKTKASVKAAARFGVADFDF